MVERSILSVPGIERMPQAALLALCEMCERHGWDVDAIATVISSESAFYSYAGAYAWKPKRTASGLIQFIESTAKSLGVPSTSVRPPRVPAGSGDGRSWSTWTILGMSHEAQIPLVESFYQRGFGGYHPTRLVDYYLVPWGARAGLPMDHVLAAADSDVYRQNSGLDFDRKGGITVADLDAHLRAIQGQAHGKRLKVEDSTGSGASLLFLSIVGGAGLYWLAKR